MKVLIKVLQGDGCAVDVQENMTIFDVKKQVENNMKIPVAQQTLVLFGKTLLDDQTVASYSKIKEGTKLHLVIKKTESLEATLSRFLQNYYSDTQIKLILEEFMKDFHTNVHNLSLDDLERLATNYLNDENV